MEKSGTVQDQPCRQCLFPNTPRIRVQKEAAPNIQLKPYYAGTGERIKPPKLMLFEGACLECKEAGGPEKESSLVEQEMDLALPSEEILYRHSLNTRRSRR
jgi:hypothetical protein